MSVYSDYVTSQRELLLSALQKVIRRGDSYALIDFPDYGNVGDSAIWLGELALLKEVTSHDPSYVCSIDDYDETALRSALPSGPVFMSGGGNFGDYWGKHQEFREHLMHSLQDRLLVQLPQSIYFRHRETSCRAANAIAAHGNVHLFVRDQQSLERANGLLDTPAVLVPDAAFGLGPLQFENSPKHQCVGLLRSDKEALVAGKSRPLSAAGLVTGDWAREPRTFRWQLRMADFSHVISRGWQPAANARAALYEKCASMRLMRGLDYLATGRVVLTDRLHGHIMATLMGKHSIVLDNNYGKVHGYIETWASDLKGVYPVENVEQALACLKRLASQQ